jgi:hypothetical protein
VRNGWLVVGDALKTGSTMGTVWWRGTVRPADAPSFGPALTRFVPGRPGLGFTDDLGEVAGFMAAEGMAAFEHHYGLWYDRRRDDHERVRRLDGEVWPPFYEQPFTRSGEGVAWDGLSRYDLTRYNPWYWSRLAEFATHCDRRGLVLIHQHYFQHNLLEAGAHWADFPWRSANNVNQTGFPEPPPYAGDKRIFQDHLFYDVSDPVRRPLHRAYIRQCLENFLGTANVIQMTSAEFTGPLAFLRFWIDTVREWEEETGVDALVGLSATRDVQDAVLEDPERRPAVSVIDIRYWWYQADGRLYAPEGGKHLSPRQHARVLRPRESSFEQVLRAVREYRERYPSIAVVYSGRGSRHAWAVLFGGGSLPRLSALEAALCRAIPRMRPRDDLARGALRWCLADPGAGYLVCAGSPGPIELDLRGDDGTFVVRWLDPSSGATLPLDAQTVEAGRVVSFEGPEGERRVAWLSRRGPAPPRSD